MVVPHSCGKDRVTLMGYGAEMSRSILSFSAVIALAILLILLGAALGGIWAFAALFYIAILVSVVDETTLISVPADAHPTEAKVLSIGLGVMHFVVLGAAVVALAGDAISMPASVALFFAAGLYLGQVSNTNAHELIHMADTWPRKLGKWVYVSLLFGHQTTAHPGIHHIHVATPHDPNSARLNESFYRFAFRAWTGSFLQGLKLENKRLRKLGLSPWHDRNPYWVYCGGAALFIGLAWVTLGAYGALIFVLITAFAQSQLLVSDYILHYGLCRKRRDDGSYEPVAAHHSWDSPHWMTSLLLLNAPRHADHHLHPVRGFEALRLHHDAPHLPHPLPVMAFVAIWPPAFRRLMTPLAEEARRGNLPKSRVETGKRLFAGE